MYTYWSKGVSIIEIYSYGYQRIPCVKTNFYSTHNNIVSSTKHKRRSTNRKYTSIGVNCAWRKVKEYQNYQTNRNYKYQHDELAKIIRTKTLVIFINPRVGVMYVRRNQRNGQTPHTVSHVTHEYVTSGEKKTIKVNKKITKISTWN